MMKRILAACVAAVALAGCASTSPERQAAIAEIQRTIPTCDGEKDCAAKWGAAQLWVVKNAGFKIQTVTGVMIQTYSPATGDVQLAATITKEPQGGGRYRIVGKLWCANPFGCHPDPAQALLRFNREVGAAAP